MKRNLNFLHITKTAGTKIEEIGKKHNIRFGKLHPIFKNKHATFLHNLGPNANNFEWFTVVRNPYTRIISEINWLYKRRKAKHRYITLFNEHLKKDEKNIKVSINNFLSDMLDNHIDYEMGDHFTPQYLYFENNFDIIILKFENLANEFDNLMREKKINIKFDNVKVNKSENKNLFLIEDISTENLSKIKKIYYKDFEMFNYKMDI